LILERHMQTIITAVFESRKALDDTVAALVQDGFARDTIHLGTDAYTAPAVSDQPGPADGVGNVLHTLFGTDDSERARSVDGAVTRGHQVLNLTVQQADVERASAVVRRQEPVSLDISQTAALAPSAPLSQLAAEPPDSAHEASWRAHHAATFAPDAAASAGTDAAAPYPGDEHYAEYAPAYLYGLDMATHEQHGGKEWEEAEPALKDEWERRHPRSAWSRFKAAVQHGWQRLRNENGAS
jgi:hypothetical protein